MQENNNNSEGKEIEFDVLTEIGNIGAGNATTVTKSGRKFIQEKLLMAL